MTLGESVIYGAIQGFSEFLPISSSGHLALLPHVMHIEDPGVAFDLMMHFGTALAVLIYFGKDILKYARTLTPSLANLSVGGEDRWFVRNFFASTVTSVFCIVLLMPISKLARDPVYIMINLTVFGILLWYADRRNQHKTNLESPFTSGLNLKLACIIGMAQALAIFPGVSRSGITLTAALLFSVKRKEAGHYSFLLSLPIILAGILKEIPDLMKSGNQDSFLVLLTGVLVSFAVGLLTIHFFMKLIGKIQLGYFAVYRAVIALIMYFVIF